MQIINGDLTSNLTVSRAYSDNVFYSQSYSENIICHDMTKPKKMSVCKANTVKPV